MSRTARLLPLALVVSAMTASAAEAGTVRDHRGSTTKVMPAPGGWGSSHVRDHRNGESPGTYGSGGRADRYCYSWTCVRLKSAPGGVLVTPR